jgi:hypothetical protein
MRYLALTLILAMSQINAQQAATPPSQKALLDKYCVTCHNQKLKTANLTFDTMDLAHPAVDAQVWERAVRKLRGGMMPPPGMPRPNSADVNSFVSWLEVSLDQAAAANPNPGNVTLHRLNRAEYTNAMRDLLGIEVDAAALLPADDISNGFDNIASVLKVSPSFLDQYIGAARAVTKQAIGEPPPTTPVRMTLRGGTTDGIFPLGTRGTIYEQLFPYDGEYDFIMGGGGGGRGGGRGGRGGGAPAAAAADGGENTTVLTLDGVRIAPGRIPVKAGVHKIGVSTPVRGFAESEAMLQSFIPGGGGGGGGRGGGGGGGAGGLQIMGPYNPTGNPIESPSRQKVFVCHPANEGEELACATKIFSSMARRAYRRPVTDKDLAAPIAFYKEGRAT